MKIFHRNFNLVLAATFGLLPSVFPQGSLTPIGTPGATMKSLDQVRSTGTAINATNTPGDNNYHFVLNAAGSYFLTGNLGVTKTNGIHVTSAGVTVYLNGFQITRGSGTGGTGILIDGTAYRCVVENGTISGFATGITSAPASAYARGGAFRHLSVTACTTAGFDVGDSWLLEGCTAHDNGAIAIRYHNGATLTNCTVASNTTTTFGVNTVVGGTGGLLTNCVVNDNHTSGGGTGVILQLGSGTSIVGCNIFSNVGNPVVQVGGGSSITNSSVYGSLSGANFNSYAVQLNGAGCSVINSHVTATTVNGGGPTNTGGIGIYAGLGDCTIKDCTVAFNKAYGIYSVGSCSVIHCTVNSNGLPAGSAASASGIYVIGDSTVTGCTVSSNGASGILYGDGCHILSNTVCENGQHGLSGLGINNRVDSNQVFKNHFYGILQSAPDADFTVRNISSQNGSAAYAPVTSGNYFGPYSVPGTATSPWANF